MAEGETTIPATETAVTEQVTDADLGAAWENDQGATGETQIETQGEVATEETQEVEGTAGDIEGQEDDGIPDEPADNRERSRLGRRMKSLEDTLSNISSKLDTIGKPATEEQGFVAPVQTVYGDDYLAQQIQSAKEQGIIPDIITTPEDIIRTNNFVNSVNQHMQQRYAQGYLGETSRLQTAGKVTDTLHDEIMAELKSTTSPFNTQHTGNPTIDARINYAEAKAAILAKQVATPKTVFKGKGAETATGVTASTRTDSKVDDMPTLDEKANEFIRLTGMKPESVKAALKEPMPFHLRGTSGTR